MNLIGDSLLIKNHLQLFSIPDYLKFPTSKGTNESPKTKPEPKADRTEQNKTEQDKTGQGRTGVTCRICNFRWMFFRQFIAALFVIAAKKRQRWAAGDKQLFVLLLLSLAGSCPAKWPDHRYGDSPFLFLAFLRRRCLFIRVCVCVRAKSGANPLSESWWTSEKRSKQKRRLGRSGEVHATCEGAAKGESQREQSCHSSEK